MAWINVKEQMPEAHEAALAISLQGCLGNSSSSNELIGQVKKVQHVTPLLFPNYDRVDVSLGVIRNGVGSMSKEDAWLYVPHEADYAILSQAAKTGELVKIQYDVARARLYGPHDEVTHAEISN